MLTDDLSGTRACRVSQTASESLSVNENGHHSVPGNRSADDLLYPGTKRDTPRFG
jgi:hypothetical protein